MQAAQVGFEGSGAESATTYCFTQTMLALGVATQCL